jgi:hypothetical protein
MRSAQGVSFSKDFHSLIKRIVTIFGHYLLDAAGCLTFGKYRKDVIGRGNRIAAMTGRWRFTNDRVLG